MGKKKVPVSPPEVIHKRVSKYFFPGRRVWHKQVRKLGRIVSRQDAGWHEYWYVKFEDGTDLLCYEINLIPFDYRNCFCGVPLSVEYEDCPECRWFICPHCDRCRCGRGVGRNARVRVREVAKAKARVRVRPKQNPSDPEQLSLFE